MIIKVKATNLKIAIHNILNKENKIKPSIDRINDREYNKMGKYYVGPSAKGNFLQVNDGKHIRYYGKRNTSTSFAPFHNLYRIVSKNGNDFVIHEAR
jgi:hypothetical protein